MRASGGVELTDIGRELAARMLSNKQARVLAERRATKVRGLPLVPVRAMGDAAPLAYEQPVQLDGIWHRACRGDYVMWLAGSTCLQLWNTAGQVAQWLKSCHDAGINIRVQVNESSTPEQGEL